MPSPVGHALGAIAAGWTVAAPATPRRTRVWQMVWLAGLGIAPDFDLLIDRHSKETHSIGAAVIAAGVATLLRLPIASSRARIFLAAFAAWVSHPLLDMFGEDSSPPIGVMLLWPFSKEHFKLPLSVFSSIYRQWREPGFTAHNLEAMLWEAAILVPVLLLVYALRRRRHSYV